MPPEPLPATGLLAVVGLLICASLILVFWNLQDASLKNANTGSRYATIESLVDHGTFAIDKSQYRNTVDKVKLGENFYSSKPPLLPTFGAGVYYVYQAVTGRTIASHEGEVVRLVGLCTGWLGHLVFLLYLYFLSRLLLRRQLSILVTVCAGAFAYLGVGYATTLNNHSAAAAVSMAALYHAARASREPSARRHFMAAGFGAGLLPALDLPSAALSGALAVWLFLRERRRTLAYFLPLALPPLLVHFSLTYVTTGSLIPVYLRQELYQYPGSYWLREAGMDALREPKHVYAFNMLIGHHGLFSMTPLLGFACIGLYWSIKRRLVSRGEAWVVSTVTAVVFVFYLIRSYNYGGWCVGMRWLVPQMGLMLVFIGVWLDQIRLSRLSYGSMLLTFAVSAFHAQDALSGPFQYSRWQNWLQDRPNRGRTGDKLNLPKEEHKKRKAKPRDRS